MCPDTASCTDCSFALVFDVVLVMKTLAKVVSCASASLWLRVGVFVSTYNDDVIWSTNYDISCGQATKSIANRCVRKQARA